jgi:hypothetical protein
MKHRLIPLLLCGLACAHAIAAPASAQTSDTVGDPVDTLSSPVYGTEMGLVMGAIYDEHADRHVPEQSLWTHGPQIFNELNHLGMRWVRIQAPWPSTPPPGRDAYNHIVDLAHSFSPPIQVIVVVDVPAAFPAGGNPYDDAQRHAYIDSYEQQLNAASALFDANYRPDAWEIVNEPNDHRMPGTLFPYLLRRVWNDFHRQHPYERIISGGILNTFTSESWWSDFFQSEGWSVSDGYYGPPERPFTYFGIHPYNDQKWRDHQDLIDQNRIADAFASPGGWDDVIRQTLPDIWNRMVNVLPNHDTGWWFFATELGFWIKTGSGSGLLDATQPDPPDATQPGLLDATQQAWALEHATALISEPIGGSRRMGAELWHQYRDFIDERTNSLVRIGIRKIYGDGENGYPARQLTWRKLRYLATGNSGNVDPNADWGPNRTFADVVEGRTFAAVQQSAAHGIISGYSCGATDEPCDPANRPYFRPDNDVTRGQFSKMLVLAMGWGELRPANNTFQDVDSNNTFYGNIERLAASGIISGYGCGGPGEPCVPPQNKPYFRPGNPIVRMQMAKMVVLAQGWPLVGCVSSSFYDQDAFSCYGYPREHVETAWSHSQAVNAYSCGRYNPPDFMTLDACDSSHRGYFHPGANAKRGDVAYFIARARGWTLANDSPSDGSVPSADGSTADDVKP